MSLPSSHSGSRHLDLGGWGGTRQIRAKGGRESRKSLRRKGALERGIPCDLPNVASSVFLSHPTLVLPWGLGGGEWDGKCDGGRWIQRGFMDHPIGPALQGLTVFTG